MTTSPRPSCPILRRRCSEAYHLPTGWRMPGGQMVERWECETCGAVWLREGEDFGEPRARRRVLYRTEWLQRGGDAPRTGPPLWTWED